jgi:pyrimidine-specific ribonucleoside hydrolase
VAACGGGAPSASPVPSASATSPSASLPPAGRLPLILDSDMSFDDVMAMAFLTTQPDVELLAVTVSGTGIAHCGPGARNARNLLNELQVPLVPTACGPAEPIAGGREFPEDWREFADDLFGLEIAGVPGTPQGSAVELLTETIGASERQVTILATGPLTNIAEALAAEPDLVAQIDRLVIMGGAVDVPGNAPPDGSPAAAEWNLAADPAAASAVLESGIPVLLVPLDATNDVRITRAFAERLHADADAGPANLVDELLLRSPLSIDVDYFWDVLAAVALVEPTVVTTEEARIAIATAGADAGRTTRAADGTPIVLATSADAAAFEASFLDGLRSGGPRRTALELVDTIPVTFDGTVCAAEVRSSPRAGTYQLSFVNDSALEAVAVVGGLVEGSTFADLDAWAQDHPGSIEQPPMVVVHGFVYLVPGGAGTALAELVAGDTFVTCLIASTGQEAIVDGPRFRVD